MFLNSSSPFARTKPDFSEKFEKSGFFLSPKEKIDRIKVVLAEKDMSYKALSELVGKTPSSISRICNNDFQPTLGLLREIVRVLKVDIRDLLIPTKD